MEEKIFCQNCGSENTGNSRFCMICGNTLPTTATPLAVNVPEIEPEKEPEVAKTVSETTSNAPLRKPGAFELGESLGEEPAIPETMFEAQPVHVYSAFENEQQTEEWPAPKKELRVNILYDNPLRHRIYSHNSLYCSPDA